MTRNDLLQILGGRDPKEIVAATIWAEARNQGVVGMAAVACVIRNRLMAATWYGKSWPGVCLNPWQFSCWNVYKDGSKDPNLDRILHGPTGCEWHQALCLAELAMEGHIKDPTDGATHYHTLDVSPSWAGDPRMVYLATIKDHRFYMEV